MATVKDFEAILADAELGRKVRELVLGSRAPRTPKVDENGNPVPQKRRGRPRKTETPVTEAVSGLDTGDVNGIPETPEE